MTRDLMAPNMERDAYLVSRHKFVDGWTSDAKEFFPNEHWDKSNMMDRVLQVG